MPALASKPRGRRHRRTVSSELPEMSSSPLGDMLRSCTDSVCPTSRATHLCVPCGS